MKKILLGATALAALLAAPIAMADPNDNGPKDRPKAHDTAKPDTPKPDHSDNKAMSGANDNAMRGPKAGEDNGPRGGGDNNDNDRMRGNGNNNNDNDRMRANDNNRDNDRARDNNNDRDNDKTVNKTVNKTVVHKTVDRDVVLKFRANIKAPRRFHPAKAYVRPSGWYQHRWVYGERLPRAFYAPDYFILNFAAFGLMTPWDGYEWVRYGDDALLIDVETGEVIRVEYDIFY